MNIEEIRDYCLSLKGAEECFPFDETTLVMKVRGKIFAFIPLEYTDVQINLKCDPDLAIELREKYAAVQPGYHMNKKYWNTVFISSEITGKQLKDWIKHSYDEVIKGLPKSQRENYS